MNACLLGEGYDNRLEYLKHLIDLEVIEIPSGTIFGTWEVPEEWVIRDAWIKYKGKKILDYKKDPLSVVIGSIPVNKTVTLEELRTHWHYSDEMPDSTPYTFKFYDKDWGFCLPKNKIKEKNDEGILNGVKLADGTDFVPEYKDKLKEGDYEVFIDSEYRPGTMKLGVHTIKGKSDREVLLFAHLDHPYQANDNLSAVACLVDLSKKMDCEHTIKIIFCPETIGSIAYAHTQDLSKVDFVIAVDVAGNDNSIMLQKSWQEDDKVNRMAHLAIMQMGKTYRKGQFRATIGSDEYAFNDPKVGIPGILLSRWPYKEYHTSEDTPEKIIYENIVEVGRVIKKIILYAEQDFIPVRNYIGPTRLSKYGLHTGNKQLNLSYDYFFYAMDGKLSLAELCCLFGLNFEFVLEKINLMIEDGLITKISCPNPREK